LLDASQPFVPGNDEGPVRGVGLGPAVSAYSAAAGTLAGIARRAAPRAPMETIARTTVSTRFGVAGDFRGGLKPGGKRQVTLMERRDWLAACAELGVVLPWQLRRANLLVDTLDLPQRAGARLRIGAVLLEVTTECDPCQRMDEIAFGLDAALRADWRGGVCARVLEEGEIALGDRITVEI
jgi:MOSC domain-containing protein YiiM